MFRFQSNPPTFLLILPCDTLDEGEDEEDDEGGHSYPSEGLSHSCKKCVCSFTGRVTKPCPKPKNILPFHKRGGCVHPTKVVDKDSAHHGPAAPAQTEVDPL